MSNKRFEAFSNEELRRWINARSLDYDYVANLARQDLEGIAHAMYKINEHVNSIAFHSQDCANRTYVKVNISYDKYAE